MGKLDGKVALITGGSEGIGLAAAQQFVAEGAYVFITGRRREQLDWAVKQIGSKNVVAIQADSSKLDDLDNVYTVIQKENRNLDILFVNAGIVQSAPLESITEKLYDDMFNINVKGVLFTVQKALAIFNDGGSIILNASNLSIKGLPASSVYCATKAAIRSFARSWTVDLKDRKIRVNALSPGPTDTSMIRNKGDTKETSQAIVDSIITNSIMGRLGRPEEIAKAAVFLASADSSYITGMELFVDGGLAQV